jgi:hypothetical protein
MRALIISIGLSLRMIPEKRLQYTVSAIRDSHRYDSAKYIRSRKRSCTRFDAGLSRKQKFCAGHELEPVVSRPLGSDPQDTAERSAVVAGSH